MNDFLTLKSSKNYHEYSLSWSSGNDSCISLIKYSEKNENYFKKKLVQKIDFFQNNLNNFFKKYNKKNLIQIPWKLNNIQDNNLYDQNYLFDLYKLVILEELCNKWKIKKIILNGSDKNIQNIIKVFCKEKNILFDCNYLKKENKKKFSYKQFLLKILPNFLITFIRLNIFLLLRFPVLFQKEKKIKKNYKINLLFVSYLSNLTKKGLEGKYFGSSYWNDLDIKISNNNIKKNWLFLYTPEFKISKKNLRTFSNNINKKINSEYIVLDSYFCWKSLIELYLAYFKNLILSPFILKILNKKFSSNYCFEIYKKDINQNIFGFKILKSLYFDNLLKNFFLKNKIEFKKIIYLYENQSWERSLLKYSNSNNCLAFLHSSLRYWDLRYLNLNSQNTINRHILKKKILVFSNHYKKFLTKYYSIKSKNIILVEYLKNNKNYNSKTYKKKLIVIGDYKDESNMSLKKILTKIKNKTNGYFLVKPHPLNYKYFKNLRKKIKVNIKENINLNNYKIFLVTNATSQGLELLLQKKYVFTTLDADYFNLSPVKYFINYKNFIDPNSKDFINLSDYNKKYSVENFYIKNKSLKNWKKVLLN